MENNNSVCYVALINEIKPIEGADNIEQIVVGGWNCIAQKNTYKVNDFVIVATTDAIIPVELSDAMAVTNYLRKGQRVRTVKLRGVYSECLLIPMKFNKQSLGDNYSEGKDMMEIMGIFKYEPPVKQIQLSSGRKIKYKDNPNFHVYYKFPNLKNVNGMFTQEDYVEITRKIHGTNARYGIVKKTKLAFWDKVKKFFRIADKFVDYEFVYGSHNVEKGSDSQGFYSTDVWSTIIDKYDIKNKLWKFFKENQEFAEFENVVIYGEIYGPGIQKNYDYGLDEIKFAGFDITIDGVYESIASSWYSFNMLDLPYVPVLYEGNWSQDIQDSYVFNNMIEGTKVPHEGIVIKECTGNRKKVAKVINPDYLIYGEKHDVGDSH
jgi:RNA ligase (TIGR02306 family)